MSEVSIGLFAVFCRWTVCPGGGCLVVSVCGIYASLEIHPASGQCAQGGGGVWLSAFVASMLRFRYTLQVDSVPRGGCLVVSVCGIYAALQIHQGTLVQPSQVVPSAVTSTADMLRLNRLVCCPYECLYECAWCCCCCCRCAASLIMVTSVTAII
jgi:hypothetical protein